MTEIFWIRHAPIAQTGHYTGQHDVEAIIPAHPPQFNLPNDAIYFSSPLKRAMQTAHWLKPDARWHYADALKEQHFGAWEGRSYDEVWRETEHTLDWSKPESVRPPQGESFMDVCARVNTWLDIHLSQKPLVIVAHTGVIRAGLMHADKIDAAQALATQIDYLSVTQVSYNS